MPSKRVIILEGADATRTYDVCYWFDVPAARQAFYADATRTSAFKSATAAETTALQTGAVLELVETRTFPPAQTLASIQSDLAARWTSGQAQVTAGGDLPGLGDTNRWERYGTFLAGDGSAWTNVTVA